MSNIETLGRAIVDGEIERHLCDRAVRAWARRTRLHGLIDRVKVDPFIHRSRVYYRINLLGQCIDCEEDHEVLFAAYVYSPHGDRLRQYNLAEDNNRVIV